MKTFLTALRYDLQRLRWILLPWLGWQLWWIFVGLELDPSRIDKGYTSYVIVVHLGWFGILTLLSFTHAPSDSRAAWRTRPLRGRIIGLEKICLGLLLLVIIPTASLIASAPFGVSQSTNPIFAPWMSILSAYTGAFLSILFVASLMKDVRQFFGVGMILIIPLMVLLILNTPLMALWMTVPGQIFKVGPYHGVGVTATCLTILLGTAGFIRLITAQYHQSHVIKHACRAGLLVALLFVVLPRVFPNYLGKPPKIDADGASITINSVERFDHPFKSRTFTQDSDTRKIRWTDATWPMFRLNISPSNFATSSIWRLGDFETSYPFFLRTPTIAESERLLLNDELLTQLGIPDYQLASAISESVIFERKRYLKASSGNLKNKKERTHLSFRVSRLQLRELADTSLQLPLQRTFPSGLYLEISKLGTRFGYPLIEANTGMPAIKHLDFVLELLPTRPKGLGRYWVSNQPLLLLIDDANKRAHILQSPPYTSEEIREHFKKPGFRKGKLLPDWNTPLDQLRLKVFEVTSTGYFSLRINIPAENE